MGTNERESESCPKSVWVDVMESSQIIDPIEVVFQNSDRLDGFNQLGAKPMVYLGRVAYRISHAMSSVKSDVAWLD